MGVRINTSQIQSEPHQEKIDGGVARAENHVDPHLPCLSFPVSLGECGSSVLPCTCTGCVVSLVGVCGGASWCLGGDEDEEVFPYCINEYLYD